MKLVGQTSGAEAYVKDLKLITDINGFLSGAFFLRNPLTNPPPSVRIATGSKVYKLTSSSTNQTPLPGSMLICSGETIYKAEGTWEERQKVTTKITNIYFEDPLAQSFSVGGSADVANGNKPNEDANGAYLTAIDLFFANKDTNNAPLTVEIRTVELGTPTRTIVGNPVVLNPSDIQTSTNASVATRVTFDYPIYLEPGLEYAIVLIAPQTDQYEVWIAEMGEKTIETRNLPDSQAIRYSRQFAIGSLFKSQNGSIWTANQYQDLKFKLYKARFTSNTGSVFLTNPTLNESNGYIPTLPSNPITILPRRYTLGINTIYDSTLIGILTTGRKVSSIYPSGYSSNYGYIIGAGSSVSSVGISTGGFNYAVGPAQTYNINGNGSGLRVNITSVSSSGSITGIAVSALYPGNGYVIGDVVGIVTSTVSSVSGNNATITITGIGTGRDTLYLSNVQGESFVTSGISTLVYYNDSGTAVSLANTAVVSRSAAAGGVYSGNFFKVNHYDHGMYANTNKITIKDVQSDVVPTTLSKPLSKTDSTISIASTSNFTTFENINVNVGVYTGYVKINQEIIKYEQIGVGQLLSITRGIDSTKVTNHDLNSIVYKYEIGGVSLRRINTTHDISDTNIGIDNYYIEFDRSSNGINRSSDNSPSLAPQLSFSTEQLCGGSDVKSTENIQFNSIIPHVGLLTPGSVTSATGQIKTTSGTSVNGTETSFIDQGYESVQLESKNDLDSTRIICSNINESTYLSGNKSFTLKIDLATTDANLSPQIFWKNSSVELRNNRLNKPIFNYITNNGANNILNDPHAAIYVSNTVRLAQQANSLKVIVSAYRHSSADFRVLYSLIRSDSSEIDQTFELFPGYNNLTIDNNQDGYYDVVDPSQDSGLPDVFVPASLENQFLEYEFTANNIGPFTGYTIKIVMSGTDQSHSPRFKDLRSIALA